MYQDITCQLSEFKKYFFRFFRILVAFFRIGVGVSKLPSLSPEKPIHFKIGLK